MTNRDKVKVGSTELQPRGAKRSHKSKVTFPDDVWAIIVDIAKRDCCSESSVVVRLTTRSLEREGYIEVVEPKQRKSA